MPTLISFTCITGDSLGMIYNDILERTGASSATISRVNRSLQYGADGYQAVLPRIKEKLGGDGI